MASPPASHPFMRQQIRRTPSPPGTSTTAPPVFGLVPPSTRSGSAPSDSDVRSDKSGSSALPPPRPGNARTSARLSASPGLADDEPKSNGSANGHADGAADTGVASSKAWDAAANGTTPHKLSRWEEKVQGDLAGWRGGHGEPRSSAPQTQPPTSTYYGQPPTGVIGHDLPKEILRVERDWHLGDIAQFSTVFPLELETRLDAATYAKFIESINAPLREAYSVSGAVTDNLIGVLTWWTSLFWRTSHFEKELQHVEQIIQQANETTFNRVGLNILSPRAVALQYLEIEYY